MRTIEIEEDVYAYLLSKTEEIGESASGILRRLLILPARRGADGTFTTGKGATPPSVLSEFLATLEFNRLRNVKDRFISVLAELYRRDPDGFEAVLEIGGRKRKYFGTSRSEVASSGKRVAPREIPGSPYWVMTNSSTAYKKKMLRDVMEALDYDGAAIREAAGALGVKTREVVH